MKIDSILTPKGLAKKLGITEQTLRSWRSLGMTVIKIGKNLFVLQESFMKWVKSQESVQDASGDEIGKSR
jgi:transposase-like protein